MDQNNVVCPVCTLYLRPGITLKGHLSSHPKQKVIEALVRLSESDDGQKSDNPPPINQQQVNTAIVNHQTWNQGGNIVNMPPSIPQMQGNHLFIYQQSMSSSTTTPQQNVLNVNPLSQQYVIPTVLNPQMMPYVYQQQQLIMSSNSCVSPLPRSIAFELPPSSASLESHSTNHSTSSPALDEETEHEPICEKIDDEEQNITTTTTTGNQEIKNDESIDLKLYEGEDDENEQDEQDDEDPRSPASDWSIRVRSDLNKACQTQNPNNISPRSLIGEDLIDDIDHVKDVQPEYYFVNESDNPNFPTISQPYEQNDAIYAASNVIPNHQEHLDFVDMDGMQMVMNDFSTNQIISQVENFENTRPERSGVLMTIGGMIDNSSKDGFIDQRDQEDVSRESSSHVNIRADERMPPRGELSGQESIGGASDITWNRIQYDGSSGICNSYDLLARETWEASDSSDIEVPPLQSRIPNINYPQDQENDDNDTPTIVSYTGPPLNFKCSTCGDAFGCSKDRREHEIDKHPDKIVVQKTNLIGSEIGKKNVKKLIVKLKSDKTDMTTNENNFDNVFTNKLKIETNTEGDTNEEAPVQDPLDVHQLVDDNKLNVELKTICSICNCILENAKDLKQHKLNVHNVTSLTRYKCSTCFESFANDHKFTLHLKIHPLECKLCGKLFYRRQNLQLHMRRHLGIKPYKCEICEKSFLTKQKHNEHRNTHTGAAPIKCHLCHETFRRHSNLVQHRNRHHLNVKKKIKDYICFCKEIFHSKKKLAWHKEIHDSKPKSCTQCNEKFIHMSSLTRHMRRAHNQRFLPNGHKSSDNVECPICKGVYLKSSLDVHIRNHSGQRPFACLICNKDFTTKWNLKLHKWTHASRISKPYKCDQCKGAFIRESDYISHMNSHKSIRPYTCNYCGAQFIRKYNCQRHVKEHENEKTFTCKVCGKNFHRSYYLKDHMRVHSGIRPYACHICGKTSTTKSNHNKHVQIHHAREPVSTEN